MDSKIIIRFKRNISQINTKTIYQITKYVGEVTIDWKDTTIRALFKKGNKSDLENYYIGQSVSRASRASYAKF